MNLQILTSTFFQIKKISILSNALTHIKYQDKKGGCKLVSVFAILCFDSFYKIYTLLIICELNTRI